MCISYNLSQIPVTGRNIVINCNAYFDDMSVPGVGCKMSSCAVAVPTSSFILTPGGM